MQRTKSSAFVVFSLLICSNIAMNAFIFCPGCTPGVHYPRYLVIHPFFPGTDTDASWVGDMVTTLGRGSGITRLGIVDVIFTLDWSDAFIEQRLDMYFNASEENDVAVLLHLDSEHFYDNRPDLWNWWNTSSPGYDPTNRDNVEWSDWDTPTTKGFLNWGTPIELAPRLCFESTVVRNEISHKCQVIVDRLATWLTHLLSINRTDLFLGIDAGWETGIDTYENVDWVPEPYRYHLGYNALTKMGYNATNPPQDREKALADVVHDFAAFEVQTFIDKGISKEKLFTHIWGVEGISSPYHQHAPLEAAFNNASVPGFSLYPGYNRSIAPLVAGITWALMESPPVRDYQQFLTMGSIDIMVLYGWSANIRNDPDAIDGIKALLSSRL
nr:hypothetical protein [Candidatus Sigynarchaeota archaeon]